MIDALWLALRAAGFILLLQASGTVLFRTAVASELGASAARQLRRYALRLTLAALLIVIVQGLLEPVHLAGAWDGIADPALRQLALASPGGVVLWLRFMGLGTLALALWRAHPGLALPAALVALGSFLVSGHTLIDAHRVLLLPLLALHVGAAAFWFGALGCLGRLAPPADAAYLRVLDRFSVRALWLVPLLGLAGVLLAATLLPDWGALRRPYGVLLLTKAALFAVLLGLAALNRLRIVPGLARGEPAAAATLRVTLTAEYLLVMVVLAVTALMTGAFSPGAG
jgi:putative copper resistance protein D